MYGQQMHPCCRAILKIRGPGVAGMLLFTVTQEKEMGELLLVANPGKSTRPYLKYKLKAKGLGMV
jgi:hypothetical protein